jgi:hypothetical protein
MPHAGIVTFGERVFAAGERRAGLPDAVVELGATQFLDIDIIKENDYDKIAEYLTDAFNYYGWDRADKHPKILKHEEIQDYIDKYYNIREPDFIDDALNERSRVTL